MVGKMCIFSHFLHKKFANVKEKLLLCTRILKNSHIINVLNIKNYVRN